MERLLSLPLIELKLWEREDGEIELTAKCPHTGIDSWVRCTLDNISLPAAPRPLLIAHLMYSIAKQLEECGCLEDVPVAQW